MSCPMCSGLTPQQEAVRDQLDRAQDTYGAPEHSYQSLHNYAVHRLPPGGFITAVLCNDLVGAVGAADMINTHALPEIAGLVYNGLPAVAWRTMERVQAWLDGAA